VTSGWHVWPASGGDWRKASSSLDLIPGISQRMLFAVGAQVGADGLPHTPLLILGGVPLKVYAGVATTVGIGLGPMLLWTVFARIVRIAPTFALVAATRLLFRRSIEARTVAWCALLVGVWVVFYVFYFAHMSRG